MCDHRVMIVQLRPVTMHNRGDLEDIDAGDPQRYWVHSPWYWHQWSLDNPTITFRLVHTDASEVAVGMVAYGPYHQDEALTQAVPGTFELIHLVIDHRTQAKGIGRIVAASVIASLKALPDCQRIVVAHHPENEVAARFFTRLGFLESALRNYDGDPLKLLEVATTRA